MNGKRMAVGRRFPIWLIVALGLILKLGSVSWAADTATYTYVIRVGDTLSKVARDHETTVAHLLELNPEMKNPKVIYVGTSIQVPAKTPPSSAAASCLGYVVRLGDTWGSIATAHNVDADILALVNRRTLTDELLPGMNLCLPVTPASLGELPVPPATRPKLTVNAPVVNLRTGPSTASTIVGSVVQGTVLEDIVGQNSAGDWLKLARGAWIAAFLVENVPDTLPVASIVTTPVELQAAYSMDRYDALARFAGNRIELVGDGIVSEIYPTEFTVIYPLSAIERDFEVVCRAEFTNQDLQVGSRLNSVMGRVGASYSSRVDLDECQFAPTATPTSTSTSPTVITSAELQAAYSTDRYDALARFAGNRIELVGDGIVSEIYPTEFTVIYPLSATERDFEVVCRAEFTNQDLQVGVPPETP